MIKAAIGGNGVISPAHIKGYKHIPERYEIVNKLSRAGKSHIAVELGLEACLAGYRVCFATVPSLINIS